MIKFLALWQISALLIVSIASGQEVVESSRPETLSFKGQGTLNLCYAFAEEQILRDFTCQNDCTPLKANQWKYSIFDIAKIHQLKFFREHPQPQLDPFEVAIDLTTNGSAFVFPYEGTQITSLRASKCTLEKEIIAINRSALFNPDKRPFWEFVEKLRTQITDNSITLEDLTPLAGPKASTLVQLASESQSGSEYLSKIIEHTSCNDEYPLPSFTKGIHIPTSLEDTQNTIATQLKNNKPLILGVCAEIIEKEKLYGPTSQCFRHSIVANKLQDFDCEGGDCFVNIVDSAFFSKRKLNEDGSTWVPLRVVALANFKNVQNVKKIIEDLQIQAESLEAQMRKGSNLMVESIKNKVSQSPSKQIKENALKYIDAMDASSFTKELKEALKALEIHQLSDLDKLKPIAYQIWEKSLPEKKQEWERRASQLESGSISWIEPNPPTRP